VQESARDQNNLEKLMKDCIKQKDVQESARNQNNFGLRIKQPPLSDVVNKAIDFQFSKIGKNKNKKEKKMQTTKCSLRLLIGFQFMSFVEVSKFVIWSIF